MNFQGRATKYFCEMPLHSLLSTKNGDGEGRIFKESLEAKRDEIFKLLLLINFQFLLRPRWVNIHLQNIGITYFTNAIGTPFFTYYKDKSFLILRFEKGFSTPCLFFYSLLLGPILLFLSATPHFKILFRMGEPCFTHVIIQFYWKSKAAFTISNSCTRCWGGMMEGIRCLTQQCLE